MGKASGIIGITDEGQPIVLPEHTCQYFTSGVCPTASQPICWYCRWADFRKTTDVILSQSICRCRANRVHVPDAWKNEGGEMG